MIHLVRGDLLASRAQALVNPVNCVGVMGRGLALAFKKAWPDNFEVYKAACQQGAVAPGVMLVHEPGCPGGPRFIINFPTKRHWRGRSRIEDVRVGLAALVSEVTSRGIGSIAIPPLGCGLGGLDWAEVRPLIEAAFAALPAVEVHLYEPGEP